MAKGRVKLAPSTISTEAPWRWMGAGWADLWRMPWLSLGYGLVFVIIGFGTSIGLWKAGLSAMIPVFAGCFTIAGPLLAAGLYVMSRQFEKGKTPRLQDVLSLDNTPRLPLLYIGFILLFGLLVWLRVATLLYALFLNGTYLPLASFVEFVLATPQGIAMLVIGTVLGLVISFAIFSLTAFSVPLLLDRKIDAFEAVTLSVRTVIRNPTACLLWAWIIAGATLVGMATALIGLVVVFPLLGHATWHAYRDVFPKVEG